MRRASGRRVPEQSNSTNPDANIKMASAMNSGVHIQGMESSCEHLFSGGNYASAERQDFGALRCKMLQIELLI